MKIKLFLSLLVAGGLAAGAQNQGYKDGIEYYKAGQYDNAQTILERTLNDASTDKALANYYLGRVALAKGDKAKAKAYFDKGLSINPDNAFNYVGVGALELLNGNTDAAANHFKQGQNLAKKNAEVTVAIARSYYNADPVKYAKEIDKNMTKARKDSKNQEPSIYVLEGDMLIDQQNYGDAAGRYESAITFDANNPEGYVKYANAYFFVNKDFAIKKLEEYLANHPESAMAQRELAEKYFQADRWRAASELYGKYIQNPNHFPEDKARYAVLLYWGDRFPESLQIAEEILAQDPSNFLMQRVRFLDQTKMEQYPAAIESAKKFFESNPDGAFTVNDYTTYAEALSGNGQDSLAVIQYELAVEKHPENANLLKELSTVYSKNKQYAKSADAYGAYLKTQEDPSLNDLFGMSGRYLNAAAYATDTIQADELANRGVEYVKEVIERTSEVSPIMYQRLGRLYVAANNKKPDANAVDAYVKMIELLDKDPENMNPANANNALALYWEGYAFQQAYYSRIKDKEKLDEVTAKLNNVVEIRDANKKAE